MRRFVAYVLVGTVGACFGLLLQAQDPQPLSNTWTPGGTMAQPRAGASGALLLDGRVLITGGVGSSGPTATAEFFTTGGLFTAATSMNVARTRHVSVTLGDGRVLVAGGFDVNGVATNTAEVYDPTSRTWTPVGPMTEPHAGHTASLLGDGRVLIAAGVNGSGVSSTFEVFHPTTSTFETITTTASPRTDHAAAVMPDGRVLLAGGWDGMATLSTTDIFHPATGAVTRGPNMNAFRTRSSATTLLKGQVLIAGGSDGSADIASADVFDPDTNTISLAPTALATARWGHLAFRLPHNNAVLIVGGSSRGAALASAELFTPWSGTFTATGSMAMARTEATGSTLGADGRLLMAGGRGHSSAEIYRFATVKTDKDDYAPGQTVTITGSGWVPFETVTLTLHEQPAVHEDRTLTATADASGNILNTEFQPETHDLGATFDLLARGARSQAQTTFTDADVRNFTATIVPTTDTAGHASSSYTLTIRNDSSSTTTLGSSRSVIPAGYSSVVLGTVTAPAGKTWNPSIGSGAIQLQAANNSSMLAPGESVSVTFTASAPCASGSYQWTSSAFDNRNFGGQQFALVGAQPTVTITGNCNPSISINDVTVAEGNAGTTPATFTVTLSATSTQTVTVNYATANGTATVADGDYQSASGTVIFAPGTTSQTITVLVNGDTKFEADETFVVNLSSPTNATIADGQGQGTITNDDGRPALSIGDATVVEGNTGTTNAVFTVTLSSTSSETVTVDYATANGTATVADGDYQSASGTVTFAPGTTSQTITVLVNGDTTFEADETFVVTLSNPSNATIADGQGQGTITNDDTAPTFSIDDVSLNEGNGGTTAFIFTVTKTGATSQTATVDFGTTNGTAIGNASCATAATGTPDFLHASGNLTFGPTETTKTITVSVCGDTTFELTEMFTVNLSNPNNATVVKGTGTGTIVNDDAPPTFSIDDVAQNEGNGGTTAFIFTVTKTGATTQPATVDFATASGTAIGNSSCAAATSGSPDYLSTSGTLSFGPTELTKTIIVLVCGDTTFELTEMFTVNLSNPSNATIVKGTGTGTIVNDDAPPTFSIDDVTQNEGNSGTTTFTFTVTKTGATTQPAIVAFTTLDGSAKGNASCVTAGTGIPDYLSQAGTLTFQPTDPSTKTITVQVCGDAAFEPNETFIVRLSGAVNATITKADGNGTINNDDPIPTLSIDDVTRPEGDLNNTFMFTVTLTGTAGVPVTVNFNTANGTATGGAACGGTTDYQMQMGALVFPPGTTAQPINVVVCGDNTMEASETFFVQLSNPVNATITDASGTGTIVNDDFAPVVSAINVTPEPSAEAQQVTVTATFNDADDMGGFTCTVNYGNGTMLTGVVTPNVGGGFTCTSMSTYPDDGPSPGNGTPSDSYTITVTVTDSGGNAGHRSTTHRVNNVPPTIVLIEAAPNPATAGAPVTVTATFTDPGTLDAHTCTINWGDGTTTSGIVTPPTGSGTCTGTHTYNAAGVLEITVTVADDDGGSDTDTAPIALIGLGDKVTGGGWITQPVTGRPNSGGHAYFGFNVKQHAGDVVPTGETNFKYRPGNLHFHSTSYEALVVTVTPDPATPDKASWWGSGTINGAGDYCFKMDITDAGEPGKNDSIRMRIWTKTVGTTSCAIPVVTALVYDNGFVTQTETTLGGGNVQVHSSETPLVSLTGGEPTLGMNRPPVVAVRRDPHGPTLRLV